MKKYLIIADDFTGSNDTGVQMCRRGLTTTVLFAGHKLPEYVSSAVIDTESRGMSGEAAYDATKIAVAEVDLSEFNYVIKKVDSTLRGNIAQEVKAVDEALQSELVIFAPALPDLGRTTVNGRHLLKGTPILETELAKDPQKPVCEDNLKKILETVYSEPVVHVGLTEIRSGELVLDNARIFTFDAEKNTDLQTIINTAKSTGKRVLYIGTAAIADNIMELESKTLPALGICASVSAVTRSQVHAAEAAGVTLVQVPVHEILLGNSDGHEFVEATIESLKAGNDTILLSSTTYDRAELDLSEQAGIEKGMTMPEVSAYVQALMGRMTKEILAKVNISGAFITGGDTAMGVLRSTEADGSNILAELMVGVPMVRIVGGSMNDVKVVTKAGAFGKEDTILFAMRKLKEKRY